MFYKINRVDDIEKVAGIFIKNGYTVTRAKKRKATGKGYDYGIDISGNGEDLEMEDEE